MDISTGVLIGISGLAAFLAGLIWLIIKNYRKQPVKQPVILIFMSLIIFYHRFLFNSHRYGKYQVNTTVF